MAYKALRSQFMLELSVGFSAPIIVFLFATQARAIPIHVTDPNPTYQPVTKAPCPPHQGPTSSCGVSAMVYTGGISLGSNTIFNDAFTTWNIGLPLDEGWTIVDGGTLVGASLSVSTFDAFNNHANHGSGGLEIQVDLDYTGADRYELVWSQGIRLNYLPGTDPAGNNLTPLSTMDDAAFNNVACGGLTAVFCGPVYPYQYPDKGFWDQPTAPFDSGFFEADAMLTKADYTTRTLTVYEGVHYEFYLWAVPEPGTAALLLVGLLAIGFLRQRPTEMRPKSPYI